MNNKGIILIFVLIIISFAVGVVLTINKNSTDKYENSMEIYFQNQASIYAITAVKAISKVLKEDDNGYDSMDDDWANIPPFPVQDGYISVHIEPLNAKININNIEYTIKKKKKSSKKEEVKIRKRFENAIETILEDTLANRQEEESSNMEIPKLGILKDWIDKDHKLTDDGDEQGLFYENNDKTYTIKNNMLESIYELKYIKGFKKVYKEVKNYFTVLSEDKKININFASGEVIKAFLPEIDTFSDDIISYRKDNPFKDVSQIREVGIDDVTYLKILPFISVTSSLFKIKILVVINSKSYYYESVVKRSKNQTEIMRFIEGAYEDYF